MADFADLIRLDKHIKMQVKSDFITYIHHLRNDVPTCPSKASIFGIESALNNDDIESSLRLLVKARHHLKHAVGVFPVFVEYAVIKLSLAANLGTSLSSAKPLHEIDNQSSLRWFLESIYENRSLLINIPINKCQQFIIPLLIQEHATVAVVSLDKTAAKKSVTIKYYDSYGFDLNEKYKQQLIRFFKQIGYNVNYLCISQHDQKDDHNCGVFTILKAIDVANENFAHSERFLGNIDINAHDYQQRFNAYRFQLGSMLRENGSQVVITSG